MLILTRNKGERIVIEYPNVEKVVIEFISLRPSELRIGIEAPKDVVIK